MRHSKQLLLLQRSPEILFNPHLAVCTVAVPVRGVYGAHFHIRLTIQSYSSVAELRVPVLF